MFRFRGALREDQAAFLSLSSADAPSSDLENGEFLRRCLLVAHCIHAFYSDHARLGASAQGNQYVREQVLQALAQGKSNKEIASSLGLSIHSVEHHVKLLKRRFGASSRVGLAQATASSWS